MFWKRCEICLRNRAERSLAFRVRLKPFVTREGHYPLPLQVRAVEKLGPATEDGLPPSLELIVPVARRLSGSCEEQCGVQHLAILAFWSVVSVWTVSRIFLDTYISILMNIDGDMYLYTYLHQYRSVFVWFYEALL